MGVTSQRRGGFTLLELMIVIAIIAIIAAIAIPNLRDARQAAAEASAIATMRTIHSAQSVYRDQDIDGNGTLDYAANIHFLVIHDLIPDKRLDRISGAWPYFEGNNYRFYSVGPQGVYATEFKWSAAAAPEDYWYTSTMGAAGTRRFFVDQTGVIRYTLQFDSASSSTWPAIGK